MPLPYKKALIPRARELRRAATKQEKRLWYDHLCTYPVRFQRQKSIDSFIVDFYCFAAKLVVELDGAQHYTDDGLQYDSERTTILEQYDLKVLRFSNLDIDKSFEGVCVRIDGVVNERITSLSNGDIRLEP